MCIQFGFSEVYYTHQNRMENASAHKESRDSGNFLGTTTIRAKTQISYTSWNIRFPKTTKSVDHNCGHISVLIIPTLEDFEAL